MEEKNENINEGEISNLKPANHNIPKVIWMSVVKWRVAFITIWIITIVLNVFLISSGYLSDCFYLLTTSSFVIALIMSNIFKQKEIRLELKELNNNISEAQKIIRQSGFGVFRYGNLDNISLNQDASNFSFLEIITEPLTWILCIALFASFFLTTPYLEFDINDFGKVFQLVLLTLIQVGMLSFVILGIKISIKKKIKGF